MGPLYLFVLLIFTVILGYLAIFDGKYGELPIKALVSSVILGVILLALKVIFNELTSKIVALNTHFICSWSQGKEFTQGTVGKALFCSLILGPQ